MSAALPTPDAPDVPDVPVTSVAGAITRMEAIGAALPAGDGLACFNRMYLDVTSQVNSRLRQGFYADPAFMTQLDVTFANLYFAAADTAGTPAAVPLAWRPLVERRAVAGIEPVQFALAGMNGMRHLRKLLSGDSVRVVRLDGSQYTDVAEPEGKPHTNLVQLDRSEYTEVS